MSGTRHGKAAFIGTGVGSRECTDVRFLVRSTRRLRGFLYCLAASLSLIRDGEPPTKEFGLIVHCFVCDGICLPYFEKSFGEIGPVRYVRCGFCGCTYAETLLDWSDDRWARWCAGEIAEPAKTFESERTALLKAQARSLRRGRTEGWLGDGRWLEYGCGQSALAKMVAGNGAGPSIEVDCYDRFVDVPGAVSTMELLGREYAVVINAARMEQVGSRAELDSIVDRLAPGGVVALHSAVRGTVSSEPEVTDVVPTQAVFYTNDAMTRLFSQWGLRSSIYDVEAQLWFGFPGTLPDRVPGDWPANPRGFMAYWP